MPYWICAIVLAVVSFLVASVLEALSLSTDSQIEAHDWYSTSGFNGAAWASCILAAALSAGLWLIPQFCWDAWALWCLLGGTAAFIVYLVYFMIDFETDRTREMWAFGGLVLTLYLSGLPTIANLVNLNPTGWGWLGWAWTLAILAVIVFVAVKAQSALYSEEEAESRAAADPERAPSKGGAALAVILIAVVAFVATQLGNVAYAAVAQPATATPIEEQATTETEENDESAAESSNGMSEEATYFQDLAKRIDTWMDLEDLQGEKAFWMTDNSMNVGLDSAAFKANTLDVQAPKKPQVVLAMAWDFDRAFKTHYIRTAYTIFMPGGNATTPQDQVCDLFLFFASGVNQAYYNAWYPGPVEFARTLTWENTTMTVSQQSCMNRYNSYLPMIDVEINGGGVTKEVAKAHGVEPSKNVEGTVIIVRECLNVADDLGVTPKTHEQMIHPAQQTTATTTTTTTTTTTPPSGGGGGTTPPTPVPPPVPPPDEPEYHKTPEESSNYGPNDNQGAGPNTNNGAGSQISSDDNPDNHTIDSDYTGYQETQDNLRENNQTQQQAENDNNEPTYTPPETSDGGGNTIDSTANNNVNGDVGQAGTNQPPSQVVAGQEDGGAYTPPD